MTLMYGGCGSNAFPVNACAGTVPLVPVKAGAEFVPAGVKLTAPFVPAGVNDAVLFVPVGVTVCVCPARADPVNVGCVESVMLVVPLARVVPPM